MAFHYPIFIAFATLFFAFWPLVRSTKNGRWAYITVASFFFYGWWDWRYLFLLGGSGLLDFGAGLGMQAYPRYKRFFLFSSLFGNLGSLIAFKYSKFFLANIASFLAFLPFETHFVPKIPEFMQILPVGISFYTFQSLSYTIDIYRGQLQPTRNLLHFFAYLSMFPQLVAGPIVRATALLPQLETYNIPKEEQHWAGLKLLIHGYFKKIVIADNLAPQIKLAFSATTISDATFFWWLITAAFAFQIYCDFSGYSDIARGLAKWMGYEFPVNFDHPYTATSFREFWTRWHISLSTWFRDYVYIPLGGNHLGKWRSEINMWLTMILSGFWHGASWNFIVWGMLHALFLTFERFTQWPARLKKLPGGRGIALFLVVLQVWLAWLFFRATNVDQAISIIKTLFSFQGGGIDFEKYGYSWLIFLFLGISREIFVFWRFEPKLYLPKLWQNAIEIIFEALIVVACIYLRGPGSEFIYFQF
jgi:D-alanyl-lipoteichoic acid acyltransferase DltB (MBOAT superfamily)